VLAGAVPQSIRQAGNRQIVASHKVSRVLPYEPEQVFDLVADVERYPDFLPWWVAVRVRKRDGNVYDTDQVIGFGIVRAKFSSKTVLRRPERIDVTSTDRPFRHFNLTWLFDPAPDGGCRVGLSADLEFRSKFLQELLGAAVARVPRRIVTAFETRAHQLYGPKAQAGDRPHAPGAAESGQPADHGPTKCGWSGRLGNPD
jgi:coenzyme Q-binding protein COQ10